LIKKENPFKQQQRSKEIASHLERTEAENAKRALLGDLGIRKTWSTVKFNGKDNP